MTGLWKILLVGLGVVAALTLLGVCASRPGSKKLSWTGFHGKKLWNILELLMIPLVLAVAAAWLNHLQQQQENQRADLQQQQENQRADAAANQNALHTYLTQISDLIVAHKLRQRLRKSGASDAEEAARGFTLATLRRLHGDPNDQRMIVTFLSDAQLLGEAVLHKGRLTRFQHPSLIAVNLSQTQAGAGGVHVADLDIGADLEKVHLEGASLEGANLQGADLNRAKLYRADLTGADLQGADLRGADLRDTTLNATTFEEPSTPSFSADSSKAQLDGAACTVHRKPTDPDQTKLPKGFQCKRKNGTWVVVPG